jgi:poly-gamma-glutamate synthesis protein (capsule biosynthesis protein)
VKNSAGRFKGRRTLKWVVLSLGVCLLTLVNGQPCGDPFHAARSAFSERTFDLDRDGHTESLVLRDTRLSITGAGGQKIWESPANWHVASFTIADANNDGESELIMVVWKQGSFGHDKPFWLAGCKDAQWSNHLFLYRMAHANLQPVWMSSALDRPILQLTVKDVDGDGQNELAVTEGPQPSGTGNLLAAPVTIWKWQSWGFYRLNQADA